MGTRSRWNQVPCFTPRPATTSRFSSRPRRLPRPASTRCKRPSLTMCRLETSTPRGHREVATTDVSHGRHGHRVETLRRTSSRNGLHRGLPGEGDMSGKVRGVCSRQPKDMKQAIGHFPSSGKCEKDCIFARMQGVCLFLLKGSRLGPWLQSHALTPQLHQAGPFASGPCHRGRTGSSAIRPWCGSHRLPRPPPEV